MERSGRVIKLLKNHLYPVYQLYAVMGNKKTNLQDGLRLGALTVMEWLCQRLDDEIPSELRDLPSPALYKECSDKCLISFHMSRGFVVDIVSIPKQGAWSLQITEPDLGFHTRSTGHKYQNQPVPGRMIETDVGFHIHGTQLECGFQVVISDPVGTLEATGDTCPAFVQRLMKHPDFGLKQVTTLTSEVERIDSVGQFQDLAGIWREDGNQLPCVVFTYSRSDPKAKALDKKETCLKEAFVPPPSPSMELLPPIVPTASNISKSNSLVQQQSKSPSQILSQETGYHPQKPPYNMTRFAEYTATYCRTYLLSDKLFERFCALTKTKANPGDIFILEPVRFGGAVQVVPLKKNKTRQLEAIDDLKKKIYADCKGKDISFGQIAFLSAARKSLLHRTEKLLHQSKEVFQERQQERSLLEAQWMAELQKKDKAYQALSCQLERQRQYLTRVEQEQKILCQNHADELKRLQNILEKKNEYIAYLKRKLSQPQGHHEIAAWVEKNFQDRLVLHPKAISLLEEKSNKTVSVSLICDALDFLATDYWERRYHRISNEEMNSRCSEKYGRPFIISPIGTTTIERTPGQYKIKYFKGNKGKPVETSLEFHLRVGNDSKNLLRIYFLHDDEKKLIVVGSLPRHLKAATIQ